MVSQQTLTVTGRKPEGAGVYVHDHAYCRRRANWKWPTWPMRSAGNGAKSSRDSAPAVIRPGKIKVVGRCLCPLPKGRRQAGIDRKWGYPSTRPHREEKRHVVFSDGGFREPARTSGSRTGAKARHQPRFAVECRSSRRSHEGAAQLHPGGLGRWTDTDVEWRRRVPQGPAAAKTMAMPPSQWGAKSQGAGTKRRRASPRLRAEPRVTGTHGVADAGAGAAVCADLSRRLLLLLLTTTARSCSWAGTACEVDLSMPWLSVRGRRITKMGDRALDPVVTGVYTASTVPARDLGVGAVVLQITAARAVR